MSYLVLKDRLLLPFLQDTVLPPSVLVVKQPEIKNPSHRIDIEMQIDCPEIIAVVFFAAQSKENDCEYPFDNPREAYGDYSNAGVALVDKETGECKISLNYPARYNIMQGMKTLQPHIHYRLVKETGILSDVRTIDLTSDSQTNQSMTSSYKK